MDDSIKRISEIISKIKKTTMYFGNFEYEKVFGELDNVISKALQERISELEENVSPSCKPLIEAMVDNWHYVYKFTVIQRREYGKNVERDGKIEIEFTNGYSIHLDTETDDIIEAINEFVSKIKSFWDSCPCYLNKTDTALLKDMHKFYSVLANDDRRLFRKIVENNFDVKFVKCEGDYCSVDYFESIESRVSEPETSVEAIVSKHDSTICLAQGKYLRPMEKKENN